MILCSVSRRMCSAVSVVSCVWERKLFLWNGVPVCFSHDLQVWICFSSTLILFYLWSCVCLCVRFALCFNWVKRVYHRRSSVVSLSKLRCLIFFQFKYKEKKRKTSLFVNVSVHKESVWNLNGMLIRAKTMVKIEAPVSLRSAGKRVVMGAFLCVSIGIRASVYHLTFIFSIHCLHHWIVRSMPVDFAVLWHV